MPHKKVLAFDIGASGGKAVLGSFDGEKIFIDEIHRFTNDSVYIGDTLYWDTLHQLHEIKNGIMKGHILGGAESIGIDTWGVDFGIISKRGKLIGNSVNYRDRRTKNMSAQIQSYLPVSDIYKETGVQFKYYNTLLQLIYIMENSPELIENAGKILLTPDLMGYFLTGEMHTEYTIASTTQLLNAKKRKFSSKLLGKFKIPENLFTEIIYPGTEFGKLSSSVCDELMVNKIPVFAVGEHNTASAVAAVPVGKGPFAYISSGTWSMLGTETDAPIINRKTMSDNFTNEGGVGGKIRFLKNMSARWLIQESRRQWQREGTEIGTVRIGNEARGVRGFNCFIDPEFSEFASPGDMPSRIKKFCADTYQHIPNTRGEIARCIYDSIALEYMIAMRELESSCGKTFDSIHIVGGGAKDDFLNSLTADACGKEVIAGPVEAKAAGNILMQLIALGEISSLQQARNIAANSFELKHYEPHTAPEWAEAETRFKEILRLSRHVK